jgi:hypothetical protein
LNAADVGLGDHPRAEGMAKVMEAQRPQSRRLDGRVVAPAERRAVDVAAELADEDKVVVLSRGPALPELGQGRRDPGRHRHRSDLAALRRGQGAVGVTRANAERLAGEVDIAPVECEQFAAAKAGKRRGQVDRPVLLAGCSADERKDLLGRVHLDVAAPPDRELLDVSRGVPREPVDLPRAAEDSLQRDQELVARARRAVDGSDPFLDVLGGQVFHRHVAERRQQVGLDHGLVAANGRRLAAAVLLGVAQVLRRSVGERRAGAHQPGKVPRRAWSRTSRSHASAVRLVR